MQKICSLSLISVSVLSGDKKDITITYKQEKQKDEPYSYKCFQRQGKGHQHEHEYIYAMHQSIVMPSLNDIA